MLSRKALLSLDVVLTELLHEEINYPIKPLLKVLQQTLWLLHLNTRKPKVQYFECKNYWHIASHCKKETYDLLQEELLQEELPYHYRCRLRTQTKILQMSNLLIVHIRLSLLKLIQSWGNLEKSESITFAEDIKQLVHSSLALVLPSTISSAFCSMGISDESL